MDLIEVQICLIAVRRKKVLLSLL